MTKKKFIGYGIVFVIGLGLVVSIDYLHSSRGVYVSIANNTQGTLKHVDIAYTGGVIQIAAVEPKTSFGRRINPDSESHLELEWIDSSGVKHSHAVDVYFEHDYRGRIEITVEPADSVSVTDKTRISWY